VSADVVALCLTVRAAFALGWADKGLLSDVVPRVEDLASRRGGIVPQLHLSLAVWALDQVLPDRHAAPWPALRDRLGSSGSNGLQRALHAYSQHVAARDFDPAGLVRDVVGSGVGVLNPSPEDAAIVVWLLTAVLERCARPLGAHDSGLLALTDQRSGLVQRLALEVAENDFLPPPVGDLETPADGDGRQTYFLSPMEALLLDLSLASPEPEDAWLTWDEARAIFGAREERERRRRAVTLLACSVPVGGCAVLGLARLGAPVLVTCWATVAALMLTAFFSARVWRTATARTALANTTVDVTATGWAASLLLAANFALPKPLLEDWTGLVAGLVVTSVTALVSVRRSH
jgi:hypothetical protein